MRRRSSWRSAVLLTAALAGLAGVGRAQAGTFQGKVDVGGQALEDAVISIEGAKGSAPASYPMLGTTFRGYPVMDQKAKQFLPRVLPVIRGATVRFLNSDPEAHNVHSASRTKVFNVGQAKKGDLSEVKFDKLGLVDVRCHIHSKMQAWIVVLDTPCFAVSNSRGLFQIENVPPGKYTAKCWSETKGTLTAEITIGSGATTNLFRYK